ncbi:MAG: hypothetical protein ACXVJL_02595 [Candidatus Angelobacter sp.]
MNVACLRKSVCLCVALLLLSVPLVACVLPGEAMTEAEQDCCLQMSDQCDSSQMSDAHTCCTKTPHIEGSTLKATSKYAPALPEAVPYAALCVAPAIAAGVLPGLHSTPDGSPSPPGSISVLRI